jgi:hypothetical protein
MIDLRRIAGLAALLVPAVAVAQNPYADQVMQYLDGMYDTSFGPAYTLEGESYGWMIAGAEGASAVRLPAGSYVVIGACDDDCSDIDLYARRIDSDAMLDSDEELDSFPVLEFSLAEESEVMIAMSMPGCSTARCYSGYRWYRSEEGAGMAEEGGGWERQVGMLLDQTTLGDPSMIVHEQMELVEAGGSHRFSLNLDPGIYGGVVVCDFDCSNVDLVVYDAGGSTVASDVLDDDVPVVEVDVRKGGGTYYFEVRMVECSTPGCGYGFRLYRDSGR